MREIKFKGMSLKGWVYGHYVVVPDGIGGLVDCIWRLGADDAIPVNSKMVCQYTGLKDKNGTEIYEGDIVKGKAIKCQGGFTYTGVIEFLTHNTVHGWHLREFDGGGYELKQLQARISLDNITGEVIGNIYEHPHLLKE